MIVAFYLATATLCSFALFAIWRTGSAIRRFAAEDYFLHQSSSDPADFCLELGSRILNSADSDFVARETSRLFARRFRDERTALALAWLRQMRALAASLMRVHAAAARSSADLNVRDEIRVAVEFLVFRLVIAALYCAVCLRGPFHAARLAAYSIAVARQFREMTEGVLPGGAAAAPLAMEPVPATSRRAGRSASH